MKQQLLKLAGASILAFSLSFLTFMSLTIAVQDTQEKQHTIQAKEISVHDTAVVSVPD